MHQISKPVVCVSHAEFNESSYCFRPRGKVRLRFSPEIDRCEQVRLKASTNQHTSGFSTRFTLRLL